MKTRKLFSNQPSEISGNVALLLNTVAKATQHICVCICTYKRPQLLQRLLNKLADQETGGLFTYSIVVADNDHLESAQKVVLDFASSCSVPIKYCVEPRQSIALTRNKAIENASGDFVAFIDDDEFPIKRWLLTLVETCHRFNADGVLGSVKPYFEVQPPRWVIEGKFYERQTYPTGMVIKWRNGRTGNTLLKKQILTIENQPFRPEFLTGEDQDFFRRMIEKGHVFVWCHEALAYEIEPPSRWKPTFILRRALLRGKISIVHPTFGWRDIARSLAAVPFYTVALPFALMLGQGKFMNYLIRLFDHIGRLLALMGICPIKDSYVTE
jgi:succinoglycan biosynthesis protein ExoM